MTARHPIIPTIDIEPIDFNTIDEANAAINPPLWNLSTLTS
jgi:hypothetical protein